MIRVYGYSDDLVEIENSTYEEDEIGCYGRDVLLYFVDGTVIRVHYGKPGLGIWKITVQEQGSAPQILTECEDADADIYSDIFEISAEIWKHEMREQDG